MSATHGVVEPRRAWEVEAGRRRQGCSVPNDCGTEQNHTGILLAEAIEILKVDLGGGVGVDGVG